MANETAAVHLQLWGEECGAFEPGDIRMENGILSYNKNNLVLRAGKRGKVVEKVGEFTIRFVETPNMSEIKLVPDPTNSKKYVQNCHFP